MNRTVDRRIFFIGAAIAVMAVLVMFAGPELFDYRPAASRAENRPVELPPSRRDAAAEAEPLRNPAFVFPARADADTRTWRKYEDRRAFPGAPPAIPHLVDGGPDFESGKRCAACHVKGGYVPKYNAYAPVTPHPDFYYCRQCHVPRQSETLFRETMWASVARPKKSLRAMPGAPPAIPHPLQMRENCLACHSGPSSVPEIRSTHPDRGNCRQCHVPRVTEEGFNRDRRPQ